MNMSVQMCMFESLLSTLLCIYLEEELLDHNSVFNFLTNYILFSARTHLDLAELICIPTSNERDFKFVHIPGNTCYFLLFFFIVAILMGVGDLIVVLICIYLWSLVTLIIFHDC